MYARKFQFRAALLAVVALAAIAAFSTALASAATSPGCEPNPYTAAGLICLEHQASSQATRLTAAKKSRHRVARKQSRSLCLDRNPYLRYTHCS